MKILPYGIHKFDNTTIPGLFFFGLPINVIEIFISGTFQLGDYIIKPYEHGSNQSSDGDGLYYFDQVISTADISTLSSRIQAAFPVEYSSFQVKTAYAITWLFNATFPKTTLYQVVLCLDHKTNRSFMIVSYSKLDLPSETNPSFYQDTLLLPNNFEASTTGSNCRVPGQFVFQFNTLPDHSKSFN
jgi:hypothetical protein